MINYVLTHVFDKTMENMVTLKKLKGPKFLHNKITVLGGKIEINEDIKIASSRETKEESNLNISPESWTIFDIYTTDEYVLNKLFATIDNFDDLKQLEIEPVMVVNVSDALLDAKANPDKYTKDFIYNIELIKNYVKNKKMKVK